jgi:hypothetical protein
MILDGPLVAAWRGDTTTRAIEADVMVIAEEAHGWVPPNVQRMVVSIPEEIDRAERLGRATVDELTCRLIAEALGCVPNDLSPLNHRELHPASRPSREDLLAVHRDRMSKMILRGIIEQKRARTASTSAKRRATLRLRAALNATRERATRPI